MVKQCCLVPWSLVYSDIYESVRTQASQCGAYSVYDKNRCSAEQLLTRGYNARCVVCSVPWRSWTFYQDHSRSSRARESGARKSKRFLKREKRGKVDDPPRKASVKWRWSVLRLALSDRRGSRLPIHARQVLFWSSSSAPILAETGRSTFTSNHPVLHFSVSGYTIFFFSFLFFFFLFWSFLLTNYYEINNGVPLLTVSARWYNRSRGRSRWLRGNHRRNGFPRPVMPHRSDLEFIERPHDKDDSIESLSAYL